MTLPGKIADLSSNNGHPINYGAAKAAGVIAVIIKATDGTGYVNPFFAGDVAGFNAVGVPSVGYHFAEFGNPQAEAAHFMAVAGPRARVLDSETNQNVAWQNAFLTSLNLPGNEELDYGSASTLPRSGIRAMLWPAAYPINPGFGEVWQYTDSGLIPGIPGKVDLSQWFGSQADFAGLFSLATPPPIPGPPPVNLLELFTVDTRDPQSNGTWIVDPADGHVEAINGAPYLGALNEPTLDRFGWREAGYISGITSIFDPPTGWGYAILLKHNTPLPGGAFYSQYTFRRSGHDKAELDTKPVFPVDTELTPPLRAVA